MLETAAILATELLVKGLGLAENGVEDAAAPLQPTPLLGHAAVWFLEHFTEDHARVSLGRQHDAVGVPGERMALGGHLQGMKARVRSGLLGHQLVHRDRVAVRRSQLSSGEPDLGTVVVMTQAVRVVQTADRSDDVPKLLERLERLGELVVLAGIGDLPIQGIHPVGNVHEDASRRLGRNCLPCSPKRFHAVE